MINSKGALEKNGIVVPEILLPHEEKLKQWAVIACDQFTQDRKYWKNVEKAASGRPSTLNIIFPEVFLTDDSISNRIADIHDTMQKYLTSGVFASPRSGFIYIERD